MASWTDKYLVGDLGDEQRLELTCRKCGRVTYTDKRMMCETLDRSQMYLDEIKKSTM